MCRVGEHIDGLDFSDLIAVADEEREVSRLCFGVAGDIDDFLRAESDDR